MTVSPKIALTMGDPAGIGPEIVVRACEALASEALHPIVVGDPNHLEALATELNLPPPREMVACGSVKPTLEPGRPQPNDGRIALQCIVTAADLATSGDSAALVTAPVSKRIIAATEPSFKGHTEFLAARASVRAPLMVFAGIRPAVALLTTHLPLATAVASVRRPAIVAALARLDEGWRRWFGNRPRIGVAGLNPHAGELGLLGCSDESEVRPAIVQARRDGTDAHGPFPADSVFRHQDLDVILALYHDQGTIMAKRAPTVSVNTTFGLPYPRTSPDHGVAYDIAGKGIANATAMIAAVRLAAKMAKNR
jgi:4-hydroxythreonine-4-phosphate dehydrogenase